MKPHFIVGIDLGTTNSVVAYKEILPKENKKIQVFQVPQFVKSGVIEKRSLLPSFLYLPHPQELAKEAFKLPWNKTPSDYIVGEFARIRGGEVPSRLVSSAKSWLCHQGVNRQQPILPFQAPEEVLRISPIDASSRYLLHLKEAWNAEMGNTPEKALEHQQIYLTVPASFDAVARELTVLAAKKIGLQVTLLEEPQAAFYAWLYQKEEEWRTLLKVDDLILIVDVGGGTTDFSLVSVINESGNLQLKRVAVGDHILLGGDNMDMTLAHQVSQKLKKGKLDIWQSVALWYACREAKESLLSDPTLQKKGISILGRGSSVIGSTLKTELTREEVEHTLVDGFFPKIALGDHLLKTQKIGLSELNLPYASDPAITRHIANFLKQNKQNSAFATPSAILFNGGVFKGEIFRKRVVEVVNTWLKDASQKPLKILESSDLDLSVAIGAVYYGEAQQGRGIRIRGGAARAYYVGIESSRPAIPGLPVPIKALCVVPYGMEEGTEANIPNLELGLTVGEPVSFPFFSSVKRKSDTLGLMLEDLEAELEPNVPLETLLKATQKIKEGEHIPVKLYTRLTEIGTLELFCRSLDEKHQWQLEFNVRG